MSSSKKYRPSLVICLSRFPFPLEKGDKLRAYYQIRDLSERFDIYLICTSDQKVSTAQLQQLAVWCTEIHVFELKKIRMLLRLAFAVFSRKPFQLVYFTSKRHKKKITALLDKIQPDHILCQLVRPAEYVKNYHHCRKTIDLMDALSKGMERRMENAPWYLKFVFREEARRLKLYERQILSYFEQALIISEQDKQFIFHPDKKEISVVPNGVGEAFFDSGTDQASNKEFDLLFTGNMSYAPNIEAVKFLAESIIPGLKKRFPDLRCLISGANPGSSITKFAGKGFSVSGWVDDIRDSYRKSDIFIAPMRSGTGMQNKILEAMAMGLPCITTRLANNAILAENGKEIILADTADELIEAVSGLLLDETLRSKLAANGREFVRKNYNWKEINRKLGDLLEHGI